MTETFMLLILICSFAMVYRDEYQTALIFTILINVMNAVSSTL